MPRLGTVNGLPRVGRARSRLARGRRHVSSALWRTVMSDLMLPRDAGRLRPGPLPISRRAALARLLGGGIALGLAACTPTPPRVEPKPTEASKPAETKPAAPAAAAPPTTAPAAA